MQRWLPALAILVGLGLVGWRSMSSGAGSGVVIIAAGVAAAWWLSPLNGRGGTRHAEVESRREEFPVVIYWRPGCVYCLRLRGALGKDKDKATWISIWSDDEAAAFVRSVNHGNETVPTVRIGDAVHTNPDPEVVRAALS